MRKVLGVTAVVCGISALGLAATLVLCSGHGVNAKYALRPGEPITVVVTVNDVEVPASKSPSNLGQFDAGQTLALKVVAVDYDAHVCDVPQQPIKALLKPATVTATFTDSKGGSLGSATLTGSSAPSATPIYTGSWQVPAGLGAEKVTVTFGGSIDDTTCDKHTTSDDPAVSLSIFAGKFDVKKAK